MLMRFRERIARVTVLLPVMMLVLVAALIFLRAGKSEPATGGGEPQRDRQAPVRLNKVIELFEAGKPAFGVFSSNPSLRSAAALSTSDADFVLVDMEHAPVDFETLQAFFLAMVDKRRALEKGNAQPDVVHMVRLPQYGRERLQFLIKQALDLGTYGLMLPHINTAEEALAAVRASRYAQRRGASDFEPAGQRGTGYGFAARVWGIDSGLYSRVADVWPHDPQGEILLMHQIESIEAVDNIDEILSVPGVGSAFIGPLDLQFSLGVGPDHPDLEKAIQRVLAACKKRGVPCGIPAGASTAAERLEQGFRFLTIGGDTGLNGSAAAALQAAREASDREN